MEIITRDEAKALGLKRYFTGKPCKHGHIDERNVCDQKCLVCGREKMRKRYQPHPIPDNPWKGKPLTAERLHELLDYEPETGFFRYRVFRACNSIKPGDIAGGVGHMQGYRTIMIDGKIYTQHRLAWLWMKNEWPQHGIDHVDCDTSNNKWANLRAANAFQNSGNRGPNKNNTTGYKGVTRKLKKYAAHITIGGVHKHLGMFETPEEASAAYLKAAEQHFGEFAKAA